MQTVHHLNKSKPIGNAFSGADIETRSARSRRRAVA